MLFVALALAFLPQQDKDPYRIPWDDEVAEGGFDQAALDAKLAEILPRLEQIRGWRFRAEVTAGVQSIADFRAYAAAALEEEYGRERFAGMTASAELLGLLPAGQDLRAVMQEVLEAAVGGYYDPKTRKFWIMQGFSRGPMADLIMAHELEHALDDQVYPLDPFFLAARGNSDREFAARCVVEGSASSAMNLYLVRAIQGNWLPPGDLMSADVIGQQLKAMDRVPVSLIAGLVFPYIEGNAFLVRGGSVLKAAMTAPTDADLRRAFTTPPLSSEQVLHPEKYWDPEQWDPPQAVALEDRSAALGAGWSCVDEDTLGELGCAFLVAERLPTALELQLGARALRLPAAAGWGGDRYRCYRSAAGARAMHLVTLWDTPQDAAEFAAALEGKAARARLPALRRVAIAGARVDLFLADEAGRAALSALGEGL